MNLPLAFEEKMRRLLGGEWDDYVRCFQEPRYYGLRVNTRKISPEQFARTSPFPVTPIPWIPNGFYYDGEQVSPARHPFYFAGLYYLQEPSAMTPASRLPVAPEDRVLDLCAAPGGKATELGARLRGDGVLAANDISSSRARGLLKNLELFGIPNPLVLCEEPGKLLPYFTAYFDRILIDAPCSGEGMFRKDRKMIRAWEEHGPDYFSRIQRGIITQAAQMLRPGGTMLYSTCTFDPEENEGTVQHLLRACPEFHVIPMEGYEGFCPGRPDLIRDGSPELAHAVRIYPHHMKGEGHFLALLQKGEGRPPEAAGDPKTPAAKRTAAQTARPEARAALPEALTDFLGRIAWDFAKSRLDIRADMVYYMPEDLPDLRGIRFLRTGLLLGTLKKNRFEPSQALAMALKKEEFADTLDLAAKDERADRYLRGETLDVGDLCGEEASGWRLVCVEGYPLGWGKLSGGILKNKYLPGWRKQSA